jgi:hypothetical protein
MCFLEKASSELTGAIYNHCENEIKEALGAKRNF